MAIINIIEKDAEDGENQKQFGRGRKECTELGSTIE
jgi:hypothetical protein